MKSHMRIVLPVLASLALSATAVLAQNADPGPRMGRTPPTSEQIAARQAQVCADIKARQAARFTYMEERLNLSAAQKPLFERWKQAQQSVAAGRQADCGKPRATAQRKPPTLTERNARMEARLKQRLADLQKVRGPEEALYNALSDEQKAVFAHRGPGRFAGHGRHMRMAFGGGGFGRERGFGPSRHGFGPRGFGPDRPGMNAPVPPAPNGG